MNYRHIFHAGNRCDVVKHAVWVTLLERLREKDKPFFALDTHAGIGLYDLRDSQALKTDEASEGILKFIQYPILPELTEYYSALHNFNLDWCPGDPATLNAFRFYPGSPLLAAYMMRPQDRLVLCELHEEDAQTLRRNARSLTNAQIHRRDGYESLGAFLPPPEKRGIVLLDPPFEKTDEFDRLAQAVIAAQSRWPQGLFAAWYPIKERAAVWRFHETLAGLKNMRLLCAEFVYQEETRHDRLNGCGIIFVNPPWQMDRKLKQLLPALHEAMQTAHRHSTVTWISGEETDQDQAATAALDSRTAP